MIKQTFEKLLGIYKIREWSNADLIAASQRIEEKCPLTKSSFVNTPQGLTHYTQNNPEIIVCRTPLGLFFPSLRHVTLEETPVLRPDQLRKACGYFIVFFLTMFLIVVTTMIFEPAEKRAPHILVSGFFFSSFLVMIIWIGTKLEYMIVTSGIRKVIARQQDKSG